MLPVLVLVVVVVVVVVAENDVDPDDDEGFVGLLIVVGEVDVGIGKVPFACKFPGVSSSSCGGADLSDCERSE